MTAAPATTPRLIGNRQHCQRHMLMASSMHGPYHCSPQCGSCSMCILWHTQLARLHCMLAQGSHLLAPDGPCSPRERSVCDAARQAGQGTRQCALLPGAVKLHPLMLLGACCCSAVRSATVIGHRATLLWLWPDPG